MKKPQNRQFFKAIRQTDQITTTTNICFQALEEKKITETFLYAQNFVSVQLDFVKRLQSIKLKHLLNINLLHYRHYVIVIN